MEVKEGKVGLDTEEPMAGRSIHANPHEIPAVGNLDSVNLNVNTVAVSSQVTLTKKSKLKERVRDGRLPVKGMQADFSETLKEKLQHKDLENQHTVRMLLMFYRELKDKMEVWETTEAKAELVAEKLKREEEKNLEVTERFNSVCEDMRAEICIAKSNNESFVKQLKALLEKYKRLQKRAGTFKQQLLEERTKKKMYQKTVNKTQRMAEELLMNRTLLEEQMDDATRELCECRKKIQSMEEEENEYYIGSMKAAEEERSALKAECCSLGQQLWKTREENKKLAQAVHAKELEKGRAERNLQESQKAVKQLYEELGESKTKTESIYLQFESMKKECKLLYNRHTVEILDLKEQQKASMEQFESMKTECEALNGVVCKLKKDKCVLKGELETLREEKEKSETAGKREAERLRAIVALLERERGLLLNEMGDLRKDYLSLSDRITQRIGQLHQTDDPMCITEISVHHHMAPKTDKAVAPIASVNMIEQIRRKLEEEEKWFHEETGELLQEP
ncbi:uncharacterized protein cccdc110 [Brachyhypopomus gauderio]|uniref:uncharacterized protein cccdc110 n=1 Tax=Brachyhypopomus gauderio TaxID=698409 RepID=UPI004040F2D5